MNPNSRHQIWSKWVFIINPGRVLKRPFREVDANLRPFMRKLFGSATTMKIQEKLSGRYVLEILSEGHPIHDEVYRSHIRSKFERFCTNGFGPGTELLMDVSLKAGERSDSLPPDQLLIIPPIEVN